MKNRILLFGLLSLFFLSLFTSCDNDLWDKHYDTSANRSENVRNVLAGLKEKGYTKYAEALVKLEIDEVLNSGMNFTFFVVNDNAFTAATAGKNDDELRQMMLNHIFLEDLKAVDFKDTLYTGMAGEKLCIWMDRLEMGNYHNEKVSITQTDIDIPSATLFELDKFVEIHPSMENYLASDFPTFYNSFQNLLITDPANYVVSQVVSSEGIVSDTTYNRKFIDSGKKVENVAVLVQSDEFISDQIGSYEDIILPVVDHDNDGASALFNVAMFQPSIKKQIIKSYQQNIDSTWTLVNSKGDELNLNADAVVGTKLFSNGNKVLFCDSLFVSEDLLTEYVEGLKSPIFLAEKKFKPNSGIFTAKGPYYKFSVWGGFMCIYIDQKKIALGDYLELDVGGLGIGTYEVFFLYHQKTRFVDLDFTLDDTSIGIVNMSEAKNVGYKNDVRHGIKLKQKTCEVQLEDIVITEFNPEHKLRMTICGGMDRINNDQIMMPHSVVFRLKQ
ncbi:hypothetical protein EMN47_03025 [Prolixibacteraceae bacterium JC049]|nr:hypothetical protein [Prolixibacteraceae bacterium JC049]